jgi:hypothetical protein
MDDTLDFTGDMGFTFSGEGTDGLGATQYTLATLLLDVTGSLAGYEKQLTTFLGMTLTACKRSPERDNILLRVCQFSTKFGKTGVSEVHGFRQLANIDPTLYTEVICNGGTPLYNSLFGALIATGDYAATLRKDNFTTNGIIYVITDGEDTDYNHIPAKTIKAKIDELRTSEALESLQVALIGMNLSDPTARSALDQFQKELGLDAYEDAGQVNDKTMARMAGFISKSTSSQVGAIGSGGPSQVPLTI